jgi:hypothetical protein
MTLILFYVIPNTSYQILVIFSPKVTCLCILFTLLSRVRLAEQTRQDGYNNQSRSIVGRSTGSAGTGGTGESGKSGASGASGATGLSGNSTLVGSDRGAHGDGDKGKGRIGVSTAGYTSTLSGSSNGQTSTSFSDYSNASTAKHTTTRGPRFHLIRFSNRHGRNMGQTTSYNTHGSVSQGQTQSIDLGASFEMDVREAVDAMERGEGGLGEGKKSEDEEVLVRAIPRRVGLVRG